MISSPFLTEKGARSPVSRRRPSPTDRTLPRLGFSLAVSGRTMPDLVLDSASSRFTRILSPRGRSLGMTLTPEKRSQNDGRLLPPKRSELRIQNQNQLSAGQ